MIKNRFLFIIFIIFTMSFQALLLACVCGDDCNSEKSTTVSIEENNSQSISSFCSQEKHNHEKSDIHHITGQCCASFQSAILRHENNNMIMSGNNNFAIFEINFTLSDFISKLERPPKSYLL